MNKLVTTLLVILVTLSIALVLLYPLLDLQNQNSNLQNKVAQLENEKKELEDKITELENQVNELKGIYQKKGTAGAIEITKIEYGEDTNPSWAIAIYAVYVTVHNYRTTSVEGLTVTLKTDKTDSASIDHLSAGETKTVTLGGGNQFNSDYVRYVTLSLNGVILDKRDI